MTEDWQKDFEQTNQNALTADWFVSPLEYSWPDGKQLFDNIFRTASSPSTQFDKLCSPKIYQTSMGFDFRAKMMVCTFMRQDVAKSYGLEIENGLMHLYRLDFASCISQWIYVIEGYCRKLFSVSSLQNVRRGSWVIPTSGSTSHDNYIQTISTCLSDYLSDVLFQGTSDFSTEKLSRHLLLHGNSENKDIYSQKNCLVLMFLLDALVTIEMAKNQQFPQVFSDQEGEPQKIERRKHLYSKLMESTFDDENLLRIEILREHY
ncbi:MAG: hypothetical protein HOP00_13195 [Nitrospira sp.]|nr:hypothetical protein [Nitrospira sp.]